MNRILIKPNLGMILPAGRRIKLGNESYKVKEFQLRHIARLERKYTRLAVHPAAGLGFPPPSEDKDAMRRYNTSKIRAWEQWPPSLNSEAYLRVQSTPEGMKIFLDVALRRFQPNLSALQIGETAQDMTRQEWSSLYRIVWGRADWEANDAGLDSNESGPDAGTDWASIVTTLVTEHGLTFEEVSRFTISQIRLLGSRDGTMWVSIPSLRG